MAWFQFKFSSQSETLLAITLNLTEWNHCTNATLGAILSLFILYWNNALPHLSKRWSAFSSLDENINSNLLDVMSPTFLLCSFLAIYFCKCKYRCLSVQARCSAPFLHKQKHMRSQALFPKVTATKCHTHAVEVVNIK